jgi:hypothetical protein
MQPRNERSFIQLAGCLFGGLAKGPEGFTEGGGISIERYGLQARRDRVELLP